MGERTPLPLRFWSKVARVESGCWEWTGSRFVPPKQYGLILDHGKSRQAHRVAWELHNQEEIPPGRVVRHLCDNPPCVNPWHLRLGTQLDNIGDRQSRGRAAVGESVHTAKLSADEVRAIRERYVPGSRSIRGAGCSTSELAREFGVSPATIWNAVSPRANGWRHVK